MQTCVCVYFHDSLSGSKFIFPFPNSSTPTKRAHDPVCSQVVHRDLAARNMLIGHNMDRATEKRFVVKLGDFGLARQLDKDGVCHTSPEVRGFFITFPDV